MIIKGLFTWRWGTLGRWGNPPVHINSYHVSAINLIWEIIWTGRLPHLSGLPHLTGAPYLHVNRPLLCFCVSLVSSWRFCTTWLTNFKGSYFKNGVDCRGTAPPLGLDIRDVAFKNTALYGRTFHERGTCDRRSDLVLWRAGHTPESIVFHLLWYSCSVLYLLSCTDIYCYLCFVTYYLRFW